MSTLYVYRGDEAVPLLAGTAYVNERRGRLTSSFVYHPEYLANPRAYQIDPELELQAGNWPLRHALPGSFFDAAPDRWGRNLIRRRYPGRRLNDLDYLLETSDVSRQGALRFKTSPEGSFEHPLSEIPKLFALPELLDAANSIDSRARGDEAVKYLFDAGTASLGGARPKAVVEDKGRLYLAKFPHYHDEYDVISAEYDALIGAQKRGINVPPCRLLPVGTASVLLVERFDRDYTGPAARRIGYISAMTALGAQDGDQHDYLEIIDFITRFGSRPRDDVRELLRRIRYSLEINNTDDHLRNHGFLHEKGGWHLSPVFDLNPNPDLAQLRQTTLAGFADAERSMEALEKLEAQWL